MTTDADGLRRQEAGPFIQKRALKPGTHAVSFRALPADGLALELLEQLAERRLLDGPLLVAEVDGELVAAAPTGGGTIVADPFRVTLDVEELLRLRSSQLRAAA